MSLTLVKHKQEVGALQSDLKEIHSQFGQRVNPRSLGCQGHCQLRLSPPLPAPSTAPEADLHQVSALTPFCCCSFFSVLPTARSLGSGVTDPRRGGKGSQSSLNSPNLQGRAVQRSVKSPARPYFSHEFPLAPSSDSISAAHRAGLEFQLFSLLQAELEGHRGRTFPGEWVGASGGLREIAEIWSRLEEALQPQAPGDELTSPLSSSAQTLWFTLNFKK